MCQFHYNDGGRQAAGYKGHAGDCVARAIAIVTGKPYGEVYDRLAAGMATQRKSKHYRKARNTARSGITVKRQWFQEYMDSLGFRWVPCMAVGTGCKVHLKADELPAGRIIVSLSRHYCAVIDGVINDTYNPDRGGTRCVYGYWELSN